MKMSSWLNTKSFNLKDEYYTPKSLVEIIFTHVSDNNSGKYFKNNNPVER